MATLDSDDLTAISGLIDARLAAYGVSTYSGGTVDTNIISINGTTFIGSVVPAVVSSFDATALAQLFTLDTTKTYTDAISGSVVKEIASHPGSVDVITIESIDATDVIDARIDARLTAYGVSTYSGGTVPANMISINGTTFGGPLVPVDVSNFNATALAQLFTLNTTKTYTDSVSGSVVHEIVDHGTSGVVNANIVSVNSNATAAVNMAAQLLAQFNGVVSADTTATPTSFSANTGSSPGLSPVTGKYVNSVIAFYNGVQAPLARKIIGYSYSVGVGTFTISLPLDAPPATDGSALFVILGYAP